jgi:alkylhydroperoxidase family enzyme
MARIQVPEGDNDEIYRVWSLCPDLGAAVQGLSGAVYGKCKVAPRVREAARMKIAHINGCAVCMGWRVPELADAGVDEELYAHVDEPAHAGYSAEESLAIEYAGKFALDHRSIDDAFFARMHEHFSDAEILELTILIGNWLGFGRLTAVLDLDEACAWSPNAASAV